MGRGYPEATPGLRLGYEDSRFSGHLAREATMASGVGWKLLGMRLRGFYSVR